MGVRERNTEGYLPLHMASFGGHLAVCEWLHGKGAAVDIADTNNDGSETALLVACHGGHLSVCKWLCGHDAAADITRADEDGITPMFAACWKGHLRVCQWLFEVGAAADIRIADDDGDTPMAIACSYGYLSICQWLVRVGAMNQALGDDRVSHGDDEPHDVYFGDGHVDKKVVSRDFRDVKLAHRRALLEWALGAVALNNQYRKLLLSMPRVVREHVGSFLGLEVGRRLRNVREFAEALTSTGSGPSLRLPERL